MGIFTQMTTTRYPVYDIAGFDVGRHDMLVMPLEQYIEIHRNKLYTPHRHSFYHAVYFMSGSGRHIIDFHPVEVTPGQMYFMIPGQVHHWEFQPGDVKGYVFNFSPVFFQSFLLRPGYIDELPFFQGQIQESVVHYPEELQPKISAIFDEMVVLRASINPINVDKIRVLALQVLLYAAGLSTSVQSTSRDYKHMVLRNFQRLVDKYFIERRHPKDYAEMLYITPNHLNALCTDILGIPAGEVIRNRIVLEAKRLLINPERSIAAIAYELNFKDNSYFTKFFKKYSGSTPEAFRKDPKRT